MPRRKDATEAATPDLTHKRLTLRQLQIFVAVARAGSTMAAAEEIALSQSATSAALNELESLLGGQLFNRVGRRLVLNEHGRTMLPQARWLLEAAQAIESEFGQGGHSSAPQLRIAASTTTGNYLLPKAIAAYRREEKAASFTVEIGNTQRVVRAVADFEVDLGFIEGPTAEPLIKLTPWLTDELVIVCAPSHPLGRASCGGKPRRKRKITLQELREVHWLLRERGSGTREVVEAALLPHLLNFKTAAELGSAEAVKQAAAEGLALACLSRHVAEDLVELGRLMILPTTLPSVRRTLYLIQHERRYVSPTLERFIAHCLRTYKPDK